jgi:hypothetical protein
MDIRVFNNLVDGYVLRRQTMMNDQLRIEHLAAGKIAEAVWGSKSFKKPFKDIKLIEEEDTNTSRNKKVFNTLKAKGLI